MVYLELSADNQELSHYKEALQTDFLPNETQFHALKEFETHKLLPGEMPHTFLFHLKRLLAHASPQPDGNAKESILLEG